MRVYYPAMAIAHAAPTPAPAPTAASACQAAGGVSLDWLNRGDNAWQLTLVALQSMPGLVILYGSIVKKKWAVNSAFMTLYAVAAHLLCWVIWRCKMLFGDRLLALWGKAGTTLGDTYLLEKEAELQSTILYFTNGTVETHAVEGMYGVADAVLFHFCFAAITIILLAGSLLGRMSFRAWMLFVPLWLTFFYTVGAFVVWGGGFLRQWGVIYALFCAILLYSYAVMEFCLHYRRMRRMRDCIMDIKRLSTVGYPWLLDFKLFRALRKFSALRLSIEGHSRLLFRKERSGIAVVLKKAELRRVKRDLSLLELEVLGERVGHPDLIDLIIRSCLDPEEEKFLVNREVSRKPSNILLSNKFEARIGSRGKACIQDSKSHSSILSRMFKLSSSSYGPGDDPSHGVASSAHDVYCFCKVLLEIVSRKLGIHVSSDAADIFRSKDEVIHDDVVDSDETMAWHEQRMQSTRVLEPQGSPAIFSPSLLRPEQNHLPCHGTKLKHAEGEMSDATVDEDGLMTRFAPFFTQQIEDALEPLLGPVACVLRLQGEDEREQREKILALKEKKLALRREKLQLQRRRACRFQPTRRAPSAKSSRLRVRQGLRLKSPPQ